MKTLNNPLSVIQIIKDDFNRLVFKTLTFSNCSLTINFYMGKITTYCNLSLITVSTYKRYMRLLNKALINSYMRLRA